LESVLVTGGTGFIGRHLIAELVRRETRVRCFVRPSSLIDHLSDLRVEIVCGDLSHGDDLRRAVAGVDTVFHVAGLTHALRRKELHRVNALVCGTLADTCRRRPSPPRLVYVSSLSASGPTAVHGPLINEQDAPHPISHYGKSKRCGEVELQQRAADLPCTVIRPGIVFGPHDPATQPLLESIFYFHLHCVVGFRTPPLSLIYVEDLVRLLLQAAERGERLVGAPDGSYSPAGYYLACDDSEHPTYWELGRRMAAALDRSVFVWPLWRWFGRTATAVYQVANRLRGKSSIVNLDKVREATASSWASSAEKARRQLGFAPASNLDTALRKTAAWYVESRLSINSINR